MWFNFHQIKNKEYRVGGLNAWHFQQLLYFLPEHNHSSKVSRNFLYSIIIKRLNGAYGTFSNLLIFTEQCAIILFRICLKILEMQNFQFHCDKIYMPLCFDRKTPREKHLFFCICHPQFWYQFMVYIRIKNSVTLKKL